MSVAPTGQAVPEGCTSVAPWAVTVDTGGTLDFVTPAFGGEEIARVPVEDGRIGHGETGSATRSCFDLKVDGGRDVALDVRVQRVNATVERLVEAGASVLRIRDEPDEGFCAAAMQDPEDNEFDVV
ncbi:MULTISPECIES: VOC family protein [unclassified Streptomyces]|uniref:VOC family protein n=1 Tax=unclassified Streptomyces TaxID=2593676 RepID=UPI0033A44D32